MVLNFAQLKPREISSDEFTGLTIALNITGSVDELERRYGPDFVLTPAHVMGCVQRAWKLNPDNANKANLILATYTDPMRGRLILGAFRFGRDGIDRFIQSKVDQEGRCIFLAEPADAETWNKTVGHYLEKPKQGEANPVRYYDPE